MCIEIYKVFQYLPHPHPPPHPHTQKWMGGIQRKENRGTRSVVIYQIGRDSNPDAQILEPKSFSLCPLERADPLVFKHIAEMF